MLFGKKKNNIVDIIEYRGPRDVLVWQHDCEDFNTRSQLIVNEGQEAVFVRDGQVLDSFAPGRYTLETKNIPLLRKLIALPSGGETPFKCRVYYINKTVAMGLEWGTDSPIEMMDPEYELVIKVTAYGDFSLRVRDGRQLLSKLVGTGTMFKQDDIYAYFRNMMASRVRSCISATMIEQHIGGLQVNTQLVNIGNAIQGMLAPAFTEYGLELDRFSVGNIWAQGLEAFSEAAKRRKLSIMDARTQSEIDMLKTDVEASRIRKEGAAHSDVKLMDGGVEAQINQMKGISEQEILAARIGSTLAANDGPRGAAVSGVMGVVGIAQSPAGEAARVAEALLKSKAAAQAPAEKPAEPAEATKPDVATRIANLKLLKGEIPEEEYQAKLKEILAEI